MMILHIAIATLLAGNGLNAIVYREDQVACSPGWVEVTQHELQGSKTCIKLQHVKQCWADARTACQRDGGDLVKILTRTMNDEIMYQVSLYEGESFWFGLRGKMNAQYTWHWLDEYEEVEQSWFQFPWSRHQLRICGEISRQTGERGSWRYRICSEPKKFICQRLPINQITTEFKTFDICSDGWMKPPSLSRSCVKIFEEDLDWQAARDECKRHGADLVQIKDARKNKFIKYRVAMRGEHSYWIGLQKQYSHIYFWHGKYFSMYFDWGEGQPNGDGEGTCAAMSDTLAWKWGLKNCSEQSRFICEKRSTQLSLLRQNYGTHVSCQAGWVKSSTSGTCFRAYLQPLTWFHAKRACKAHGADLVKIVDRRMNNLIAEKLSLDQLQPYWIGINDFYEEGSFHWLDEVDKPKYTNWRLAFKSIAATGLDCAAIHPGLNNGVWITELCQIFTKHPYVCEKLPGPTPCLNPNTHGWFGVNCKHKCHCADSVTCSKYDGSCSGPCGSNRFGPACQYAMMRFQVQPSLDWLKDKNQETCNDEGTETIKLTLDTPVFVKSIHLVLKNADQLQNIAVIISKSPYENRKECNAHESASAVCTTNDVVHEINLVGSGVKHLCYLRIFEGNVRFEAENKSQADIAWLNDNIGTTCNNNISDVLNVTLDRPRKLEWVRFFFNRSDSSESRYINISSLASALSIEYQCENPRTLEEGNHVDVLCRTDRPVDKLHLDGPGVKLLCGIVFSNVRVEYSAEGTGSTRFSWLTDNDDSTCNERSTNDITVTLDTAISVKWFRMVLKSDTSDRINLHYKTATSQTYSRECERVHVARVDSKTFDLYCATSDLVRHLRLFGPGVKQLCSLYISQGRNVAVKQAAEQSSKMDVDLHDASFAVDGREQAAMASPSSEASSCTMTNIDSPSWWRVTLSLDALLTVIYISHNEDDHMRSFSLVAESRDGQQYTHNDTGGPAPQVYTVVPSPTISFPVHTVLIRARQGQPLALCEVGIFGETVCPQGQFGLRCQWACNCLHTHSCLSHSGGCPYGCANGFHGEDCYTPKD